jgi:hypothetical protein
MLCSCPEDSKRKHESPPAELASNKRRKCYGSVSGLLEGDIASGSFSCTRAQLYAATIHSKMPETTTEFGLGKLAKIGAHGRWTANCERDFHVLMRRTGKILRVDLDTVDIRIHNPETCEVEWKKLPILSPPKVAKALYKSGPRVFKQLMTGGECLETFWRHHSDHAEWFRRHPAYSIPDKSQLVGVLLHGDDVKAYKNADGKTLTVSWAPECSRMECLLRYFAITVLPMRHI